MKIALLGCGVVGGGVLEICDAREDIELKYILYRAGQPRGKGYLYYCKR